LVRLLIEDVLDETSTILNERVFEQVVLMHMPEDCEMSENFSVDGLVRLLIEDVLDETNTNDNKWSDLMSSQSTVASQSEMCTLLMTNIPLDFSQSKLKKYLAGLDMYAKDLDLKMPGRSRAKRGHAYIKFEDINSASWFMQRFQGQMFTINGESKPCQIEVTACLNGQRN
jgi:hypothetical protein